MFFRNSLLGLKYLTQQANELEILVRVRVCRGYLGTELKAAPGLNCGLAVSGGVKKDDSFCRHTYSNFTSGLHSCQKAQMKHSFTLPDLTVSSRLPLSRSRGADQDKHAAACFSGPCKSIVNLTSTYTAMHPALKEPRSVKQLLCLPSTQLPMIMLSTAMPTRTS